MQLVTDGMQVLADNEQRKKEDLFWAQCFACERSTNKLKATPLMKKVLKCTRKKTKFQGYAQVSWEKFAK